ncbi:MAG: CPBP family intramembrane glutamic endopeptidase [Desulfobacterales bacterium]
METETIDLRLLLITSAGVLIVEGGMGFAMRYVQFDRTAMLAIARCLQIGLIIFLVIYVKNDLSAIGIKKSELLDGLRRGVLWSIAFALAVLTAGGILMLLGVNTAGLLDHPLPGDTQTLVRLMMVGGIIGPVAEEVFFRGICYGFFRRWGIIPAVLLSTAVFVAAHAVAAPFPVTQIIGGILFAVAYEVEKNLLTPIVIHASGNLALYSVAWLV